MAKIVIIGAMKEEIAEYNKKALGSWKKHKIIIDSTGVGKPAAAAKTQQIIDLENPDLIIFTGLAGALKEELNIGDICIASESIDSDLDVTLWDKTYKRGEQPESHDRIYFSDKQTLEKIRNSHHKIKEVFVASGSAFLDLNSKKKFIEEINPKLIFNGKTPDIYDMESSAVLLVAKINNKKAIVIRAVSDSLNGDAVADFNSFCKKNAMGYIKIVDWIIDTL